jgi:predicted permease
VAFPDLYDPKLPLVTDVETISERVLGTTRPFLLAMLGAVAFVLIIASVNVASLLLASGENRRRETAVAVALGASRGRLAIRSLAESVVLTLAGAVIGAALAVPASRLLVAMAPVTMPRLSAVHIDAAVLAFAVLVAFATAVVSGAVPLIRAYRDADADLLRSAGRDAGPVGGRTAQRTQSALVIAEIALAVMMLAGAGLLTRSLLKLQETDLGFTPQNVLTARITLPTKSYPEPRGAAAVQEIVDRIRQVPTVTAAAAMAWTPIVDSGGMWSIVVEGVVPKEGTVPLASPQQVTREFFDVMSIPIRKGRGFAAADTASTQLVAIVNERFASAMWPAAEPIGRRFRMDNPNAKWITVVGLAGDTRVDGLTESAPPMMYFPHAQAGESAYFTAVGMTLMAKSSGDTAALASAIRAIVRETDPNVPVSDVRTMNDVVGGSIARERFTASLVSGFAALAAMLAGVGIYGVIAYSVAQRRFEIGVRMALGAARGTIMAGVVKRGLMLSVIGLVIGTVGAFGVGRLLRRLLVDIPPIDPLMLSGVAVVLLGVSLAALIVPALRAMRVNPTETLRNR